MLPNTSYTVYTHMGVSKNRGTPKWMRYNGKPYFLNDDLGGKKQYFWRATHMVFDLVDEKDILHQLIC